MNVRELIELLQTMPQDAIVITTMASDYDEVTSDHITLKSGVEKRKMYKNCSSEYDEYTVGLIRHWGHLMDLDSRWLPKDAPEDPEYLTAVHFAGN